MTIVHNVGLHARPAANFARLAKKFDANITITNMTRNSAKRADAKSLIGVIKLACAKGHSLHITADGADEREAMDAISKVIEGGEG